MNTYRTFGGVTAEPSLEVQDAKIGEMNFAFIDMGQGDCTIISAPDNTVYIVDCGSSGGLEADPFNEAHALVRSWAKGKSVNMIMTHPDKDHYNQFIDLLVSKPKVGVNCIYFSRALKDSSPLGYYKETAMMRNIYHFGRPLLIEVTLNSTEHHTKKWLSIFNYEDPIQEDIPETGYVLKEGTTKSGKKWSISIIAGNVKTTSNVDSIKSNVVSLCTLVQFGSEKMLLTGDSTEETLSYLWNKQKPSINNVSIFQVPHHGSDGSLPTAAFRDWVNPNTALVSVGFQNNVFNLPRYEAMAVWLASPRLQNKDRVFDYWRVSLPGYNNFQDLKDVLDVKWKKYKYVSNKNNTFFWLQDIKDAQKSGTGFYGFTNKGYFLFRASTKKDLYQTGILGSLLDDGFTL